MEVTPGWLEPLLDRFTKDMNALVYPRLTMIDVDTLIMGKEGKLVEGFASFKWNMDFTWGNIKTIEGDHPTEMWAPKRSPSIFGAAYAISKSFFTKLGMFDPDFDVWGGEDVE